ncbi:MAG: hypothetical protein ACYC1D_00805 [Acidimicrobiales bacterium]
MTATATRPLIVLVGYWSGVPCRLLPLLQAVGYRVDFFDLMDSENAEDDEEHPLTAPELYPAVTTKSVGGGWESAEECREWANRVVSERAEEGMQLILCEWPGVVAGQIGRSLMAAVEAEGGGVVIAVEGVGTTPTRSRAGSTTGSGSWS